MRFFDRYGRDIHAGDTLQNYETGNLLTVQSIDEDTVFYTMAGNPSSPVFSIPASDDGRNFVLRPCNQDCN